VGNQRGRLFNERGIANHKTGFRRATHGSFWFFPSFLISALSPHKIRSRDEGDNGVRVRERGDSGQGVALGACWELDAGCWMLDAGCWVLGAGCWVLGAGGLVIHRLLCAFGSSRTG
jgi:hypothetical protein